MPVAMTIYDMSLNLICRMPFGEKAISYTPGVIGDNLKPLIKKIDESVDYIVTMVTAKLQGLYATAAPSLKVVESTFVSSSAYCVKRGVELEERVTSMIPSVKTELNHRIESFPYKSEIESYASTAYTKADEITYGKLNYYVSQVKKEAGIVKPARVSQKAY